MSAQLVTLEGAGTQVKIGDRKTIIAPSDVRMLQNAYFRGYFTNWEIDYLNKKYPEIMQASDVELMGAWPAIIAAIGGAVAGVVGAVGGAVRKKKEAEEEARQKALEAAKEAEERKKQQQQMALMIGVPVALTAVVLISNMPKRGKK